MEENPESTRMSLAKEVIEQLVPSCKKSVVLANMRRENIVSAEDLAALDKADLAQLGLNMLERTTVHAWAEKAFPDGGAEKVLKTPPKSPHKFQKGRNDGGTPGNAEDVKFWAGLVKKWADHATPMSRMGRQISPANAECRDEMLEELHCLLPSKVSNVYYGMNPDADGTISVVEFGEALQKCGLPAIENDDLEKILDAVCSEDGALEVSEFEDTVQKLMLARLLEPHLLQHLQSENEDVPRKLLIVTDYNSQGVQTKEITGSNICEFLIARKPKQDGTCWIHMTDFDSAVLLALAVKYSLQPPAIEEVFSQCATKTDNYDTVHLIAIERLSLNGVADGSRPVQVLSQHVTLFCAGEEILDTVVTLSQDSKSFVQEWPQEWKHSTVRTEATEAEKGAWLQKITERLHRPHSRLRGGGAQLLTHTVIQMASNDISVICDAYSKRLDKLEEKLRRKGHTLPESWMNEVTVNRRQLGVVMRRLRGLQRAIRRLLEDKQLSEDVGGSLEDILDHMDEAGERVRQSTEKAGAIIEDYRHVCSLQEKHEKKLRERRRWNFEEERSQQANKQNNILLVLAIVTAIFTPLSFLAGVYGMNFMTKTGKPAIPELRWHNGYLFFWSIVIVYLTIASIVACCATDRKSVV